MACAAFVGIGGRRRAFFFAASAGSRMPPKTAPTALAAPLTKAVFGRINPIPNGLAYRHPLSRRSQSGI